MKKNRIAIAALTLEQQTKAEALAARLHLPCIAMPADIDLTKTYDFLLLFTPEGIGLQDIYRQKKIFYIDFLSGKMRHRSRLASLKTELLAKALGQKPKDHPVIIDATAGLGRDSFILAALGFHVTMIERSPILSVLLQDGLHRAKQDKDTAPIVHRLQLIQADAQAWLPHEAPQKPGIIYLDPMFPERKKSASVKKDMIFLQALLEEETDSDQLLNIALTCATRRVVVKRPRLAPNLADLAPHFSIKGKSSRFDVYLIS